MTCFKGQSSSTSLNVLDGFLSAKRPGSAFWCDCATCQNQWQHWLPKIKTQSIPMSRMTYYELQAILEHDICMRIQVYQPLLSGLTSSSNNYMSMSCKHDTRSMIFPNCTCKHVQNSAFSVSNLLHSGSTSWVLPAIDDHDVAKQVLSVALLPATLQWSNLAQMQAWKGQSPNTWVFFAVVIYGKWEELDGFEQLLLYKSTIYSWFDIKVLVLVPHDMCFSSFLSHHPTKSHIGCHIWSFPA